MAKRKSGKQRAAQRRRNAARKAATETAPPRRPLPVCPYCDRRHEGECPGPYCAMCGVPIPPEKRGRPVTCGLQWCQRERRREMTRARVHRFRERRRAERDRVQAGADREIARDAPLPPFDG